MENRGFGIFLLPPDGTVRLSSPSKLVYSVDTADFSVRLFAFVRFAIQLKKNTQSHTPKKKPRLIPFLYQEKTEAGEEDDFQVVEVAEGRIRTKQLNQREKLKDAKDVDEFG